MSKKILVIQGPNLNLLGEREPGIYGSDTFESINNEIVLLGKSFDIECKIFQSNYEGAIIDEIHNARKEFSGIIMNPGAFTHYSYAIRDAISAVKLPCIEVHISNVHAREEFRSKSVIAPVCLGQIAGLGKNGYLLALRAFAEKM